jgi:putative endonuclease
VYILTNKPQGSLYVGVTNNLVRRIWQHRNQPSGFTKKYHAIQLVYYEVNERIEDSLAREKQLKHWKREWKIELIETNNPQWFDLYGDLVE